ncbi:heterokaryon incompatibility protein (HET) domain-containing protein [Sarocladium implicatum]|nr:heterokaryon incompatibility protein (HET) domain-containing protein [Sarocladium implicatum]
MRLLNTASLELKLFMPEYAPDYVILSHRWTPEEVVFDDFAVGNIASPNHPARSKIGFGKVLGACQKAADDKYDWIWIDSCCIDKSSSAVLQESINSMWQYYANANICYVYMADVPNQASGWTPQFLESEWFDRGWTLQELLAPRLVEFYARDWSAIGTKIQRCDELVARTYINRKALLDPDCVDTNSTATRMSWAAHRRVTREEDQAYCLLGLFQVAMPMLYGEGAAKAFGRLQEAIYNSTRDDSQFLFRYNLHPERMPLLAQSPTQFCPRAVCQPCSSQGSECLPSDFSYEDIFESSSWSLQAHEHLLTTITPRRFEATTTLLLLAKAAIPKNLLQKGDAKTVREATHIAILNHTLAQYPDGAICLFLQRSPDHSESNGNEGALRE